MTVFTFVIFLLLYACVMLSLVLGLHRLQSKPTQLHQPFVSILVPARNEQNHIGDCLESLAHLSYPRELFEVLLIDDDSTDTTLQIARSFKDRMPNLRVLSLTSIPHNTSPKKAALLLGIEQSRGEIIFTTDADCRVPKNWVTDIVAHFDENTGAVASWLRVDPQQSLLGHLEALDSLSLVLVGAAAFSWKRPFVANGANFAYRKQVFVDLNGFNGSAEYASGDDDLFLQKIASSAQWNLHFADNPQTTVWTRANERLSGFFAQRFRWASKGLVYPLPVTLLAVFIYIFYLLLVASPCLILFLHVTPLVLLTVPCKLGLDWVFIQTGASRLNVKVSWRHFLLTEALQMFYILIAVFWGSVGNYNWKGRCYSRGRVRIAGKSV